MLLKQKKKENLNKKGSAGEGNTGNDGPLAQIKSKVVNLEKENLELKRKLRTPILKSKITGRKELIDKAQKLAGTNIKGPLDMI